MIQIHKFPLGHDVNECLLYRECTLIARYGQFARTASDQNVLVAVVGGLLQANMFQSPLVSTM